MVNERHSPTPRIYLAGPINGRTDEAARGWREAGKALLHPLLTVDPMDRDYRGMELQPGIAAEIVEEDKRAIDASSALLVMFDGPSVGTAMEAMYARTPIWPRTLALTGPIRIPVFVVDASAKPISPWLLYHARSVHQSLPGACLEIRRFFGID